MQAEPNDDAIMREMAHMGAVLARHARQRGVTTGALGVLAILAGHDDAIEDGYATRPMTQVDLAEAVGVRPQSIGPLLSRLENNGFIRRKKSEDDRRAHVVLLTESGRAEAQEARSCQRAFAQETLAVLTDEEKHELFAILLKLNTSFA